MKVSFKQTGGFDKTDSYLKKINNTSKNINLDRFGRRGVSALANATPTRSGKTANAWTYSIEQSGSRVSINFENANVNNGVPIAVIIQYGHGTRNGGWVEGVDYVNPAITPIFNDILNEMWKEVTTV